MGSLTGLVQESLIALLLYDKEHGKRVRTLIPAETYDGPYRGFARKASAYWDQFDQPPGEHTLDLCEDLVREDPRRKDLTRRLFDSIQECKDRINAEYVFARAAEFLRGQALRQGIIRAAELLESDNLDEADAVIQRAVKNRLDLFYPGIMFNKMALEEVICLDGAGAIPTGIKQLDEKDLGPAVGELHLLMAPANYGKSWYLAQLTKSAVLNRKSVVYVTLEMGEKRLAARFLQSFFAISKRRETSVVSRLFEENELGQFCGITAERLYDRDSLQAVLEDRQAEARLRKKLEGFRNRSPLVIRQFPTSSLTVRQLCGYLESLEGRQGVSPDLLVVDYPDLMHLESRQEHRIALGRVFQELRGIAIERNLALAAVTQTNRQALGKQLITEKDVSEDYSKIGTADTVISYNQTDQEQKLGLARLHVIKARNDEKGFTVLISQNYAIGQFYISSARMLPAYWDAIKGPIEETDAEEEGKNRDRRKKPVL